jgi:biofilm PGA synthesis N-glycosyltransferase PgaC
MSDTDRYVVVSPVKDEATFVTRTLDSMCNQTVRPYRWVLVDDGSTDGTREILERFAAKHSWVQLARLDPGAPRQTGSRVIRTFLAGYERLRDEQFDFVVKLDCDLEIPPDYFENLLHRFRQDPTLGIASGIYLERRDGRWAAMEMPPYHAAGAMKMLRAACYRDIGGFVAAPGWDAVDEIKALVRGWKTRHFTELRVLHLKDEGSGVGFQRMSRMSGEIHYLTGGGALFFFVKAAHRLLFGRPRLVGSLAMMRGYLTCVVRRPKKLVDPEEARYYRRMLNRRMFDDMIHLRAPKTRDGARYA